MILNQILSQVDTVPAVDPGETVNTIVAAGSSSQWALLIGAVLCLIVWVIRKFVWTNVNSKILPWLAVAIGACGGAGFALIAHPEAWLQAIILGVNGGMSAAATWGLLGVVRK
jgi:hypothetical protein